MARGSGPPPSSIPPLGAGRTQHGRAQGVKRARAEAASAQCGSRARGVGAQPCPPHVPFIPARPQALTCASTRHIHLAAAGAAHQQLGGRRISVHSCLSPHSRPALAAPPLPHAAHHPCMHPPPRPRGPRTYLARVTATPTIARIVPVVAPPVAVAVPVPVPARRQAEVALALALAPPVPLPVPLPLPLPPAVAAAVAGPVPALAVALAAGGARRAVAVGRRRARQRGRGRHKVAAAAWGQGQGQGVCVLVRVGVRACSCVLVRPTGRTRACRAHIISHPPPRPAPPSRPPPAPYLASSSAYRSRMAFQPRYCLPSRWSCGR